ncbi:MAG: 2-oxoacid:acceptor oxidoreductase subunit alpha [Synergistaceae bacterium]|jgi:2-oxoglutarate ferredoxin oxidoreductase subunit alpha|nr:2-oxoacid:acceptor oxidoreductase subunit alpha [Synergistaceae bacterium]
MQDFSILIGGSAGSGVDKSALILGDLINQSGYRVYIYHDYPSLIRGGHTFSIIRAAQTKITAHRDRVDFLLALNKETLELHKARLDDGGKVICDSEILKEAALSPQIRTLSIPTVKLVKEENAPEIMRNTCLIGAFAKAVGIKFELLEKILRDNFTKDIDTNIKIAKKGYDAAEAMESIQPPTQDILPLISGSQAMGLGLIKGGLEVYVSYPMTPTSALLHFLAEQASDFSLKVIHPENELSVILMSLGFAYAGKKTAVGTSGGGFCLMTESLSLSAMSEVPTVIVLGQRPGPSTGLPTYSSQSDLHFALYAGHGEFVRFVVAPGDLEEAYYWSACALNLAWRYQIPSIILTDKDLNECISNFDVNDTGEIKDNGPYLWDGATGYQRYADSKTGISPLAFVPEKNAVIKASGYEHDESGITTEDAAIAKKMQDKRLRKEKYLAEELKSFPTVKTYGDEKQTTALLCWGSTKGICVEVAQKLGLKVIQPIVLSPFPEHAFRDAMRGIKKLIAVENNATGQLVRLIKAHGIDVDETILKYDGRPFTLDELEKMVKEKIA